MSCKCASCCKTFNPYAQLGPQHGKLLNYLLKELPDETDGVSSSSGSGMPETCVAVDIFVGTMVIVATSWETIIGPVSEQPSINNRLTNPFADVLSSFAAQTLQHYWSSNGMDNYNAMQRKIIGQLLYELNNLPPESIGCYLSNCDSKISRTAMTNEEKNTLYLATAIGKGSVEYWLEKIENPEKWASYLDSNYTVRRAKIAFQVCAAMKGALIGAANSEKLPQIYPLDKTVIFVAIQLAGAATDGAAVVLNMLPKAKGMNGNGSNGGYNNSNLITNMSGLIR